MCVFCNGINVFLCNLGLFGGFGYCRGSFMDYIAISRDYNYIFMDYLHMFMDYRCIFSNDSGVFRNYSCMELF